MNLTRTTCLLSCLLLAACGGENNASTTNNATSDTNNVSQSNNATTGSNNATGGTNNGTASTTGTNNVTTGPGDPVRVDCVSDLVTASGNYYVVSAAVFGDEARIELINYYAATPTNDPVEESIWSEEVDAELTDERFAFEAEQHFLDVSKAADEAMYRGTMSGETQFGDVVPVTCWPDDLEHPAEYQAESGTCVDSAGEAASNEIPWMVALRTGFGQCTAFEGALAGEATGATFDFIDLRGADFSSAILRSAVVQEVELEGANLEELTIESASISGTMDEHTVLPAQGCQDDGTTFTCVN